MDTPDRHKEREQHEQVEDPDPEKEKRRQTEPDSEPDSDPEMKKRSKDEKTHACEGRIWPLEMRTPSILRHPGCSGQFEKAYQMHVFMKQT